MGKKAFYYEVNTNVTQYLFIKAETEEQAEQAVKDWIDDNGGLDTFERYEVTESNFTFDACDEDESAEKEYGAIDISDYVEE